MWSAADIILSILGALSPEGDTLVVDKAHIDGGGLHAIGRKLLEEADVAEIVIKGAPRSTGRCKGRTPRPIRYPHG